MRCLTLAEELRDSGAEVSFISRMHPGNLNELIREKGFSCHELPGAPTVESNEQYVQDPRSEYASWLGVSQQQDARETIEAVGATQADWLIVDHYGLDKEWERLLRPHAAKIMVIDDLADRRHDCDLLLDQNFFIDGGKRYDKLISPSCTRLLGPKYALLRKEFREARTNLRERTGEVKRVLVFLGGGDPENITELAIEALSDAELLNLQADVVIGSQNPHREKIEKLVQARPRTTLHIQANNMAELMCTADLAIGAGGSTTWERLYLGLPSIAIPIAKNQILPTKNLYDSGVIMSLGRGCKLSVINIKEILKKAFDNPEDLIEMSKNGINMISCNGLKDLTALLAGQLNGIKISYRKATLKDSQLYWEWANDPEVRKNAFNSSPISWEEHQSWFQKKIKENQTTLLVFETILGPIGQVRMEYKEKKLILDYSISRQYRGLGFGVELIKNSMQTKKNKKIRFEAYVKKENLASIRTLEKAGFIIEEIDCKTIAMRSIN
jgi:UDP-2,4-diacetamido-2,4,6-trideoxy-beta-L-altropyranose hydrolase